MRKTEKTELKGRGGGNKKRIRHKTLKIVCPGFSQAIEEIWGQAMAHSNTNRITPRANCFLNSFACEKNRKSWTEGRGGGNKKRIRAEDPKLKDKNEFIKGGVIKKYKKYQQCDWHGWWVGSAENLASDIFRPRLTCVFYSAFFILRCGFGSPKMSNIFIGASDIDVVESGFGCQTHVWHFLCFFF